MLTFVNKGAPSAPGAAPKPRGEAAGLRSGLEKQASQVAPELELGFEEWTVLKAEEGSQLLQGTW